jgi:L-Lysine epsilon oxidase N-terminal/L-lysine epsilon oxidase C-terminal domain
MTDSPSSFRIHPAIGVARVGNSDEHYIAPETMAGIPGPEPGAPTGGLPIKAGTESEPITDADLRDRYGALKRQAARFRVFQYPAEVRATYPTGSGTEVQIGSQVDDKRVVDVIWTVHLANKKANSYVLNDDLGIHVYEAAHAAQLELRNAFEGADPNNPARIRRLVIDPGPRAIRGTDTCSVMFDKATRASFCSGAGEIVAVDSYPKSFPDLSFAKMYAPVGTIDSIGELRTEENGRLLVLPAHGRACGWLRPDGTPFPLIGDAIGPGVYGDVNADGWFDDTGDGPVSAVLVFDDGSVQAVHGAWAIATDPSFAPQVRNVVTLWDDIFDTWVRELGLMPSIFKRRFRDSYRPSFQDDLYPVFRAVALQRWTTNLPERAIAAHDAVGAIAPGDAPGDTILTGLAFIRNPYNEKQADIGAPFMPLSMGDSGFAFLTVTLTQYFFLAQWDQGLADQGPGPQLGPGEYLDKATLANCLGGRFAPGIEMTYIVRDPWIYEQNWEELGCGPFRLRSQPLDYAQAEANQPFLTVGYVPLHPGPDGITPARLEPGDASKIMAVPWHTDYNSCATHNTAPNSSNSTTLYWSWPAQRPVQIHRAEDVRAGKLGPQRYSVRGAGTEADDLTNAGRYQALIDIVLNWHRIGFVIQGSVIVSEIPYSPDQYLEVLSHLDVPEITPWPMNSARSDNYSGSQFAVESP